MYVIYSLKWAPDCFLVIFSVDTRVNQFLFKVTLNRTVFRYYNFLLTDSLSCLTEHLCNLFCKMFFNHQRSCVEYKSLYGFKTETASRSLGQTGQPIFVIRTLDKVDSAGSTWDNFSPYKRGYDWYKCFKFFYVFFKNWPINMNATFEVWPVISSFWTDFDRSGRALF